jgi:hypothetical protein
MAVGPRQRFTRELPCPICGGYDRRPRGRGERCYGFLSKDGRYAHCTREEFAGDLVRRAATEAFAHRLEGPCQCGRTHRPAGPSPAWPAGERRLVASWSYSAVDGSSILYVVDRFETTDGKTYAVRRPAPPDWRECTHRGECRRDRVKCADGWISTLDERPCSPRVERVLYNQAALPMAARADETIHAPEGEGCVDALGSLGLLAVTSPFGAGRGKWLPRFSALLAGWHVVIYADADDPGRSFAQLKAQSLWGTATSIRIIDLYPDRGDGSDIADWVGERRAAGIADADIRAELEGLVAQVPEWQPQGQSEPPTSPPTRTGEVGGEVPGSLLREFTLLDLRQRAQQEGFSLRYLPFLGSEDVRIICMGYATLAAAYPKGGKTTLLFALARHWAAVGHRVLYFTEEAELIWKARLLDSPEEGLDRVVCVPSLGADPALLLGRAEAGNEDVVIVDTTNLLGIADGNDAATVRDALTPWVAAGQRTSKTTIFSHHTNKSLQGDLKAVAGSYNFAAVVDCVLLLRPDESPNRRVVGGDARVFPIDTVIYELRAGQLRLLGDPKALELGAVASRCVAALSALPDDKRTTKEVLEAIGTPAPSLSQVQEALRLAAERGELLRDPSMDEGSRRGVTYRWWRPTSPTSPPSSLLLGGGEVGGAGNTPPASGVGPAGEEGADG